MTIGGLAAAALCGGLLFATSGSAGQKLTVGYQWPPDQLVGIDEIDHAQWDTLLQKYVDEQGFVDYAAWHASREDQAALDQYLKTLSRANLRGNGSREGTLAFWINAYNSVTIHGILREYPTDSIRNHTSKVPFQYNLWQDLLLQVGGRQFSLEQMEHEILRKLNEPRIHFAIVCASVGCPRLLNRAYASKQLNEQLTENTLHFFKQRDKFQVDISARCFLISPILDWFAKDFGGDNAERLRTIAPYLPSEEARRLAQSGQVAIRYLDYDWSLNAQARQGAAQR